MCVNLPLKRMTDMPGAFLTPRKREGLSSQPHGDRRGLVAKCMDGDTPCPDGVLALCVWPEPGTEPQR